MGWTWLVGRTHTAWRWFWVMLYDAKPREILTTAMPGFWVILLARKVQRNHWPLKHQTYQWPAQPPLLINALLTFVSLLPHFLKYALG